MPLTLTPEQEQRLRDRRDRGELTAEQLEAFSIYEQSKPQAPQLAEPPAPLPPPPAPEPVSVTTTAPSPRSPVGADDPRAASPWYQQLWEKYIANPSRLYPMGVGPYVPENIPPGEQTDVRKSYQEGWQGTAREMLSWAPTLAMAAYPPIGVPAMAFRAMPWAWLAHEVGKPLVRAATTYGLTNLAERAANVLDPSQRSDPELAAGLSAGGELAGNLGGRQVGRAGRAIGQAWGETPWGQVHREEITRRGGRVTPGMVSGELYPRGIDIGLAHSPFGGHIRRTYDKAADLIDTDLQALRRAHPGSRMTAQQDVLRGRVSSLARPGLLASTPKLAREAMETMPGRVEASLKQGYSNLDATYLSRKVPWHFARQRLPYLTRVEDLLLDPSLAASQEVGAESIFGQTVRLAQNLADLPDQITLDTALDMQRTVRRFLTEAEQLTAGPTTSLLTQSINDRVRPALGQMQQQINEQIAPYLVSLQTAKEHAQKLVATRGIPESVLRGQQASGSLDYTKDADILAAYDLLRQPDYVTFTDAHGLRSDMLKISRLPGTPLIGDSPARQGQMMGQAIENAMRAMGERLTPSLVPAWRVMDEQYKAAAQLYNSPYIMGVADKSLDDLLTTLVQNERPNDLKALRVALGQKPGGGDVLDDVAQMWLTRKIGAVRQEPLQEIGARQLLGELNALTPLAERELFPGGLTPLRRTLRRVVAMDDAFKVAREGKDPLALQKLKTEIGDPALWEAVQSDVLSGLLQESGDRISGTAMLNSLDKMYNVRHVLFRPEQLQEMTRLAHTARALEQSSQHRHMYWSPVVRAAEHGLIMYGIGELTGNPYAPVAYLLATPALAKIMTMPSVVKLLTRGMTTPMHSRQAGDLVGQILGELTAHGSREEVTEMPRARPVVEPQFPD